MQQEQVNNTLKKNKLKVFSSPLAHGIYPPLSIYPLKTQKKSIISEKCSRTDIGTPTSIVITFLLVLENLN